MKTVLTALGILCLAGCSKDATAPVSQPAVIEFDGGRSTIEPVDDSQDAIEFRNWVKKAHYPVWLEWHGGTAVNTVGGE